MSQPQADKSSHPTTGDKPVPALSAEGGSPPEGAHVEQKGGYKSPNYGSSSTVANQQQAAELKVDSKDAKVEADKEGTEQAKQGAMGGATTGTGAPNK